MSEYKVIGDVDEILRQLLWARMQFDSEISSIIRTESQISFEPPFKLVKDIDPEQNHLSLYLYRIVENSDMKNRSLEVKDAHILQYPPLSLNLYYLVTPLTNSTNNDHKLLGKAIQVFYDHGIVKGSALRGVLENTAEELRIILNPISMEDVTKLWSAFLRSYRLSVSYEVKVIYIDSERETEAERVRRKRIEYTQAAGV
jgi:hypothetical protein